MRKVLNYLLVISIIMSMVFSVPISIKAYASDEGYTGLDLSMTKTVFDQIGQSGKVVAAVVNSKSVNMYKSPYYSSYTATSDKYYAVNIDPETHEYLRKAGESKTDITRPQRTILTKGLTYSVDNTSVIRLNEDGSFETVGYGMANITVTYDSETPEDISDDVTNAVTIICSDDHRMSIGQGTWSDSEGTYLSVHEKVDGVWQNNGGNYLWGKNASAKAYQNFRLNWDPMADSDGDLVVEAIGSDVGNLTPYETYASREGGYIKNSPVIMHAWFYDSMNYTTSGTRASFISFGYSATGTNAEKTYSIAGFKNSAGAQNNSYHLIGGDYTVRSTTYKGYTKAGAALDGKLPESSPSGVRNTAERTKGWHQFVVTSEPSIVNPGTDYLLTKVYLDGKQITAQDIYVGDIPVENRQCNLRVYSSKNSANTTETATPAFAQKYTCYKDIYVAGYKNSKKITDSIPSNGAVNVPLYHPVKVKLGSMVNSTEEAGISLKKGDAPVSFNASLDETKTILTIDAGRYDVNTTYTLTAAGEEISFTTGADAEFADVLDDMKTKDYVLSSARYLDFVNENKSAEEYGVGFCYLLPGMETKVDDGVLTVTEGARQKEFTAAAYNSLIIRNVSPHVSAEDSENDTVDRVVVSYKAKYDKGYSTTNNGNSGPISTPIMGREYLEDKYNPHTRSFLKDSARPYTTGVTADKIVVDEDTGEETLVKGGYTVVNFLVNNKSGTINAVSVGGAEVPNSRFSVGRSDGLRFDDELDEDGYVRVTYVIDVNEGGAPRLNFVLGDDLHDLNKNFEYIGKSLDAPYTFVDSLYLSLSHAHETNTIERILRLKDIQIYTFNKAPKAEVGNTISVKDSTSGSIVYADALKNITVDASIYAKGSGEYNAAFMIINTDNNMLEKVKVVSGSFSEQETEIKAENIVVPDKDNLKLCVYIWNSLEKASMIREGIVYETIQQ